MRVPLHVTVADAGDLPAVIEAVEGLGHAVECPAFEGRERLKQRDELLREAHGLMTGTPWGRCVQLEAAIARFESTIWCRWRDREAPPEGCSALRSLLFRARQLGPLPSSARQLLNVVAKCGGRGDFGETPL